MNDLNTQQIVLLTLLVSFVTSIATGITTVSLLEQAPEPVTQTINRVVEKTVERVVEVEEGENGNSEPRERVVETVVVNEEDLTIEAVEKNSNSLVRLYRKSGESGTFVSIGVIVSSDGQILTTSDPFNSDGEYYGRFPDSSEYELELVSVGSEYTVFNIAPDQDVSSDFREIVTGNSQNIKLGQSVIALSGQDSNAVSTGIVTSLETATRTLDESEVDSDTSPTEEIDVINTSVNPDKVILGSVLLNLQGELVGFKRDSDTSFDSFRPSSQLVSFLNSFDESSEENTDQDGE